MIIYNYDEITKEYTGQSYADLNPEETKQQGKNVYLIPANATTVKPPKAKQYETVIYGNGWEIVDDYRGLYMVNSDMQPLKVEQIGALPEGFAVATEEQTQKILEDDLFYIVQDGKLIENPDYEAQKKEREDRAFNAQFFNTSLGYVRRTVTMKDGSTKDFLSDILPLLQAGIPVLTYTRELEQNKVIVTDEFINECKQQVLKDFYGGV